MGIINALHKGAKTDPPKSITIEPTTIISRAENSIARLPLRTQGSAELELLFTDVSSVLNLLSPDTQWLQFSIENEQTAVQDEKLGRLLLYHLNRVSEVKQGGPTFGPSLATISTESITSIFAKADPILSSAQPDYDAVFLVGQDEPRMIATDTIKFLRSPISNCKLTERVRIPWRLVRAMATFSSIDQTNMPVTVNEMESTSGPLVALKLGMDYAVATKASSEFPPLIDKAMQADIRWDHAQIHERSALLTVFDQMSKYLAKETEPGVWLELSSGRCQINAVHRHSAGSLAKELRTSSST